MTRAWGRKPKPASPAREFERRVAALPLMPEDERKEAIRQIGRELGITEKDRERSYAGI
jgi:isopentenyldiphosphate isomerase